VLVTVAPTRTEGRHSVSVAGRGGAKTCVLDLAPGGLLALAGGSLVCSCARNRVGARDCSIRPSRRDIIISSDAKVVKDAASDVLDVADGNKGGV
jgi:hypothetical protein